MENFENIRLPWPEWEIVKYLGGGAYGVVYEIERNISGIQEKAALKIVSRPKDNSEIESYYDNGYDEASIISSYESEIRNYIKEYKLMKELQGQSNIVSCDDFKVVPHENGIGGDIFIRMELLTSLAQVLRKKKLSEQEIIKLGKDISHALILCESKNIIHRDIKPANIMVSQFGDYKLGDFGVSKIMDHTTYATKMGTQEYQAPEVVHMEKYGHTADIYSLGITLYWLLNNRRMPFIDANGKITAELKDEAMDRRYRGEKLPAPKNGSDELKRIVLKACAYRPENRYASAQEMYDALDKIGIGYPTVPSSNPVYGHPTVPSLEDDWMGSGETVGKIVDDLSGRQTEGNSWGGGGTIGRTIGRTIGKLKENTEKKQKEVQEEPKTIGVKKAYQEQKKKVGEAKKVAAEKKKKAKKVVTVEKRDNKSKIAKDKRKVVSVVLVVFVISILGWVLVDYQLLRYKESINWSNYKENVDDNGNVVQRTYYYKTGRLGKICEYDETGKMTKETDYDTDGKNVSSVSEYNENEERIKWINYDDGKVSSYDTYEYDEKGNKIKETSYDDNDKVEYVYEHEYDENGNEVKLTKYDGEGQLWWYEISEYDSDNEETKKTLYDSEGNIKNYTVYEKAEEGKAQKWRKFDANGNVISESK